MEKINEFGKWIIFIGMVVNLLYLIYRVYSKVRKDEYVEFSKYAFEASLISGFSLLSAYLWNNKESYFDWLIDKNNSIIFLCILCLLNGLIGGIYLLRK